MQSWAATKQKTTSSSHGFTIIELLIVIVIIAILAAITLVAYNGIQVRSQNLQTIAAMNQAIKLLDEYKVINGDYPTTTSGSITLACIGTGYVGNVCLTATDGVTPSAVDETNFDNALLSVGTMPSPNTNQLILGNGDVGAGGDFEYVSKMIRYHLNGANQACSISGATGYTYGNVTQCRIVLP